MTWIERLFARVGYVPADRYVPQEHVDEVERALGEARAEYQAAWSAAERARNEVVALEGERRATSAGLNEELEGFHMDLPAMLAKRAAVSS